jgi:hypothetical protein
MKHAELSIVETIEINPPEPRKQKQEPEPEPRKPYLCRHIFVDGRQCGSRALRGQNFCYYHYAHRTPVLARERRRQPKSGFDLTRLDGLDNHTAIQLCLSEVLGRIANNTIDPKNAWLLLYGLQIAGHNLRYAHPTPPVPVPETIIEDAAHGQLAQPEPGRLIPESEAARLFRLLSENPGADLDELESIDSNQTKSSDLTPVDRDFKT